jgi:hypothetical protein
MNRYYIGQEVVCVKNGKKSGLVKDRIYTILELRQSPCRCKYIDVYVGIQMEGYYYCEDCKTRATHSEGKYWHHEEMFAPLQDMTEQIEEALSAPRTLTLLK